MPTANPAQVVSRRRALRGLMTILLASLLARSAAAGDASQWEAIEGGTDEVEFARNPQSDAGVAVRLHNRTNRKMRFRLVVSVKDEAGKRNRVSSDGVLTGLGYWSKDFEGSSLFV